MQNEISFISYKFDENGSLRPHFVGDDMIVEVRAAEGGMDAKLLVEDQLTIYSKLAERRSL